jgi:hypothetical protein
MTFERHSVPQRMMICQYCGCKATPLARECPTCSALHLCDQYGLSSSHVLSSPSPITGDSRFVRRRMRRCPDCGLIATEDGKCSTCSSMFLSDDDEPESSLLLSPPRSPVTNNTHSVRRRMMRCERCDFITTALDGECATCGRFLRPHYLGRHTLQEHHQLIFNGRPYQRQHVDQRLPRFIATLPISNGGLVSEHHQDPIEKVVVQPRSDENTGAGLTANFVTPSTHLTALPPTPSCLLKLPPPIPKSSFTLSPKKSAPIVIKDANREIATLSKPDQLSELATQGSEKGLVAISTTSPRHLATFDTRPSSALRSQSPVLKTRLTLSPTGSAALLFRNSHGDIWNASTPASSSTHGTPLLSTAARPPKVKLSGQYNLTPAPPQSRTHTFGTAKVLGFSSSNTCGTSHGVQGLKAEIQFPDRELEYGSDEADTEDANASEEDDGGEEQEEEGQEDAADVCCMSNSEEDDEERGREDAPDICSLSIFEEEDEIQGREDAGNIYSVSSSEENAKPAPRPRRRQNQYCQYHGKCRHTTEECDVIAGYQSLPLPVELPPVFEADWTASASYHTSRHRKKSRQQWKAHANTARIMGS